MPLLTLITAGASDRFSSGRNALVTRTTLITLVSNTSSASSPVSSDAATRAPMIPALLISVSMRPSCASTSATARRTEPSSVTSIGDEARAEAIGGGLPAVGVAGADDHRLAELDQAAGGLVAEALVGPGDEGNSGHEPSLPDRPADSQGRVNGRKAGTTQASQ